MAPNIPFVRQLFPPSSPKKSEGGQDVVGIKRAVSRAGYWPWQPFDDVYSELFSSQGVKKLQKDLKVTATGVWNEKTQTLTAKLPAKDHPGEKAFDAVAIALLKQEFDRRAVPSELVVARNLLAYCSLFDGPYVWGGEHDGTFLNDDVHDGYDCSSSTSSALAKFNLLGSSEAHVSGWFKSWGDPGPGKYVTIHAADDHVWMEFTLPGAQWARFDTSPHGDGPSGPRVRHKQRDETRFVSRHPRGM